MLGHLRDVGRARVVEHARAPTTATRARRRGVARCSGLGDEILVAELEVAAARVLAEPPRRQDLRPPPRRELRRRSSAAPTSCPRSPSAARGTRAPASRPSRTRCTQIASGKSRFEQRQMLHVQRRLVAPARLALALRVRPRRSRRSPRRRHPLAQRGRTSSGEMPQSYSWSEAAEVVEEVVEVRAGSRADRRAA